MTEPPSVNGDDGLAPGPLDVVAQRLRSRLPHDRVPVATAFARAAFRRLPADRFDALDADRATDQILEAVAFVDSRHPGELAIRVRPSPDATSTLVEVNVDYGPFVLSTVAEELHRLGYEPVDLLNPVFGAVRDAGLRLTEVRPARDAAQRELYLLTDLQRALDAAAREEVAARLRHVLADAQRATRSFTAIKEQVTRVAGSTAATAGVRHSQADVDEVVAFLHWLLADHFVLLGYREYAIVPAASGGRAVQVVAGSGLGILTDDQRSSFVEPVPVSDLPPALRARAEDDGDLLIVDRTNRRSTVHRQVPMTDIAVKVFDADGHVVGQHRLLGLFAQKAFAEPSSTTPVLRSKLRAILEAEDVVDHSTDERALRELFDSLPKQELFETPREELRTVLGSLLESRQRGEVRLLLRTDPSGAHVSALVTVPRDRFSSELRERVQALLKDRLGGSSVDYQLSMTERDQPILHFTVHREPSGKSLDEAARVGLELGIAALTRTWTDRFIDALASERGEAGARETAAIWVRCMPAGYTETTPVASAIADVEELEQLAGTTGVRMRLVRDPQEDDGLRFRLYKAGAGVELSSFLPILESLGLVAVEEVPFEFEAVPVWGEVHVHDYGVRAAVAIDVAADGARIADAALALWRGRAEVDDLNRLVGSAGLGWDDVAVLRAYRRYRRQVGTTLTERYTDAALVENPRVAKALLAYFSARFDPGVGDEEARTVLTVSARQDVLDGIDAVASLDHDRILRDFLDLIDATLRTNRWCGREWLALKFDSAAVPRMPKPVPHREVFVYSPRTEGVHLRAGPIARGGLRWSDRVDDYRTEVLGLMKAQVTKNAVIVPTGSKGGFVLKRTLPADQVRDEVRRQYEVFVRGILDVTDNVVGGRVVAPARVVRADGDDPYLVVAADRGTATFSDLANAISAEYGFWLGDAFASGGSQGYDHKAMGITARGAWVAVQRHFRELDVDVQTDPVRVVGVGDMSGDVFGNGLLRSHAVDLVGAFDHRDIFLDPEPDAAVGFAERQRLYQLPGSSWRDYDRSKISIGGGVFSRAAKSVQLSAQARQLLRVDAEALTPGEVVQALMRAPVDLLFFGGIGTFVRAPDESDSEVGDRANDAVRVAANELAARVVGEGGNLAMTQRGRIAYARRGGRCNTDAVDNVAGVDTSDHEVNLKILLALAQERAEVSDEQRVKLLDAVADDVADAVLRDVYLQTWTISQELVRSQDAAAGGIDAYELLMGDLESRGQLDRAVEVLPSSAEVARRRDAGAGLVRPELAVLLAYAKIDLAEAVGDSALPDQPHLAEVLAEYFPRQVVDEHGALLGEHRLRRDLIATEVANDVVNRMGITWTHRTAAELVLPPAPLVAAYWAARDVVGADAIWRSIEAIDGRAEPALQLELKAEVDQLVDALARFYVARAGGGTVDVAAVVDADAPAFAALLEQLTAVGVMSRRSPRRDRAERLLDLGIDEDLAAVVAVLPDLHATPAIAAAARTTGKRVTHVGAVFALLGESLPFAPVAARLRQVAPEGEWERLAHRGLADDLAKLHERAARQAIAEAGDADALSTVVAFLDARALARQHAEDLVHRLTREPQPTLAAVAVSVRALGALLD